MTDEKQPKAVEEEETQTEMQENKSRNKKKPMMNEGVKAETMSKVNEEAARKMLNER